MSNTIMVVEAGDKLAVEWTKPDDFTPDAKDPIKGLPGHHPRGFNASWADGSVHFISETIDAKTLQALFTRNGKEPIDMNALNGPPRARPAAPAPAQKAAAPPPTVEKVEKK